MSARYADSGSSPACPQKWRNQNPQRHMADLVAQYDLEHCHRFQITDAAQLVHDERCRVQAPGLQHARGTKAMRASGSWAVLTVISHKPLCAGKDPYS